MRKISTDVDLSSVGLRQQRKKNQNLRMSMMLIPFRGQFLSFWTITNAIKKKSKEGLMRTQKYTMIQTGNITLILYIWDLVMITRYIIFYYWI